MRQGRLPKPAVNGGSGASDHGSCLARGRRLKTAALVVVGLFVGLHLGWLGHDSFHRHNGPKKIRDVKRLVRMHTQADATKQRLEDILRWTAVALNKANVTYWLESGTLLGFHRENGVIRHDDDVDLWVPGEDFPSALRALRDAAAADNGIGGDFMAGVDVRPGMMEDEIRRKMSEYETVRDSVTYSFPVLRKNDVGRNTESGKVDVCCAHTNDTHLFTYTLDSPDGVNAISKALVYPLRAVTFLGVTMYVPRQTEAVLRLRFGDDFMVPHFNKKGPEYKGTQWILPSWLSNLLLSV